MNFRKLLTYLTVSTAAVIPFAGAQNPTILQGSYISNVFGNSNFVKNPNAQTNVANVTTVTATVTRSTTTPLVATSEFNVAIGTANGTATWATRTFDAGMKNNNCEARFTYRGFAATSQVHIKQSTNVVASLTLTPATDPRIASINFPCGDLSTATTFVVTDTAILAGTNEIGGIYVGLATNMANVAQAEFVGSLTFGSDCGFITTANTYATPTDASCTTTPTGNVAVVSGVKSGITINDTRPGTYRVVFNTSQFITGANDCRIQVTDGTTVKPLTWQYQTATTNFLTPASHEVFYQYTTSGTRTIEYQLRSNNNVSSCEFSTGGVMNHTISVYRFPSSSELVVTPERQNTFAAASWPVGNTGGIYSFSTTSTTAQNVVNTGFASGSGSYYGAAAASATTNGYGMKVNNIPPGVYRITAQVSVSQTSGYDCQAELHDNSGRIGSVNSGLNTKSGLVVIYRVTSFQTSQDFLIKLRSDNASTTCTVNTGNGGVFNPSIVFEPLDQPSNSALYVQGPVKAAETGAAISAGYVGEVKYQKVGTTNISSNAYTNLNTVTLTNGVWLCSTQARIMRNGATVPTNNEVVSCLANSLSSNCTVDYSYQTIGVGYQDGTSTTYNYKLLGSRPSVVRYDGTNFTFADGTISASATGILAHKVYADATSGQLQAYGTLECVRLN
jgi:hypothetical protein